MVVFLFVLGFLVGFLHASFGLCIWNDIFHSSSFHSFPVWVALLLSIIKDSRYPSLDGLLSESFFWSSNKKAFTCESIWEYPSMLFLFSFFFPPPPRPVTRRRLLALVQNHVLLSPTTPNILKRRADILAFLCSACWKFKNGIRYL